MSLGYSHDTRPASRVSKCQLCSAITNLAYKRKERELGRSCACCLQFGEITFLVLPFGFVVSGSV